jgi:hypothetical protein
MLLTVDGGRGTVSLRDREQVMSRCVRGLGFALVLLAAVANVGSARAASWLEMNFGLSGPRYEAGLPECGAALGDIASAFAEKEGRFWNSPLEILGFQDVRETAFRPWAEQSIPRRFCTARAQVSDGRWHQVHYVIAEDTGPIGASWGVQWCVVGLDRNWAYNPACKMARP